MNTKLKKIYCKKPYRDSGDRIKVEVIDDNATLSYSPYRPFNSNDTRQIEASIPVFGMDAKISLRAEPDILIGEKHIHVSSPSHGEKTVQMQKDASDYEITYEVV
jgi:hypothetical protein